MRIGVLGGGQLGRMMALAGIPLGHEFVFFESAANPPAGAVGEVLPFPDEPDKNTNIGVLTYEFENVESICHLFQEGGYRIEPPISALTISSDRLNEKDFFVELEIPTPKYRPFTEKLELAKAAQEIGFPSLAKTRRFGYDGKGQVALYSEADFEAAEEVAGEKPMLLESFVPFEREVSLVGARDARGEYAFYPLVENVHREGILRMTIAPAPDLTSALQNLAERYARRFMESLDYVGVMAIEFFQIGSELLANEVAPRVHNSGHWTIEGAETSQFENHIRAITGMPLGSTSPRGQSAMFNFIGTMPPVQMLLGIPGTHLHLYGKEARPGRKLGHVTLRSDDSNEFGKSIALLSALIAD